MRELRAIVSKSDGLVEAQLLELNMVVAAESVDELIDELEYALTLEYQIARELGKVPFANVAHKTSHELVEQWRDVEPSEERLLNLPGKVMDALSIALHAAACHISFRTGFAKAA